MSGKLYSALTSKARYGNYHLRFQYRWGEKTCPPRTPDKPRDSGDVDAACYANPHMAHPPQTTGLHMMDDAGDVGSGRSSVRKSQPSIFRKLYACLIAVVGLTLAIGGASLLALGGSPYYLLAGLAVLGSAVLLWLGRRGGFSCTPPCSLRPSHGQSGSLASAAGPCFRASVRR